MRNEEYYNLKWGDKVLCRTSVNNTYPHFVYKIIGFYGTNIGIALPYGKEEYTIPIQQFIRCFDVFKNDVINKNDITKQNRVLHPSHYTWLKKLCGIEVIDITRHMNFNLGNVIKYVLRSGHKSEEGMSDKQKRIEDLKKAVFYLNDEINRIENDKEGI